MHTLVLSLKSDFNPPAGNACYEKNISQDLFVKIETPCIGKAAKICADIETAMDYGAFPAAHAVMIERVKTANETRTPLSCTLGYAP